MRQALSPLANALRQTSRRIRGVHTSSTSLGEDAYRLRDLIAKFQDPTSHYHIPPGTSGPQHEEDHSTSRSPLNLGHGSEPSASSTSTPKSASSLSSTTTTATGSIGRKVENDRPWLNDDSPRKAEALRYFTEKGYDTAGVLTWPVAWGDCDMFQHVNNVRYLQWFESARIRYAESWAGELPEGSIRDMLLARGTGFILKDISIKYKAPVTYPDTMMITNKLHTILSERASFGLTHIAWSLKDQRVAALCDSTIVMYDYDNIKKGVMSDEFRRVLERVEASYGEGGSA
ncbi:hypothetical protein IAR55_006588 [Kwoniella newhampshirensis]|uniref:Thioesterase n=1 Tax=Kwoniella newhampshirensis TaxID=1651941 RepID=A0AAW0YJ20_9TREE